MMPMDAKWMDWADGGCLIEDSSYSENALLCLDIYIYIYMYSLLMSLDQAQKLAYELLVSFYKLNKMQTMASISSRNRQPFNSL